MLSESQMELLENMCEHEMKADKSQAAHSDIEVLKRLSFVLHDHRRLLETALDIVGDDATAVAAPSVRRCVSSSCGRSCWKVKGSQNNEYVCLDKYCSCPSYFNQVKLVQGKVEVLCKHLLAIRVALMLKRFESEYVSDELFVELLCVDTATGDASSTSKPYRNWRRQQQ